MTNPVRLQAAQITLTTTPTTVGNNKVVYVYNSDATNSSLITVTNAANVIQGSITVPKEGVIILDKAIEHRIQIDANSGTVLATPVIWRG